MISQYMKHLLMEPAFQNELKNLKLRRPPIVRYDASTDNVREVIHSMMRAEGFDLCIAYLESK